MSFMIPKKPQILYAPMLATFGGGSARGFNPGGGPDGLPLSAITFDVGSNTTNLLDSSYNGPAIGDLSYGTRSDLVDLNFSVDSTGIQSLDVPETGTYNYTIKGASSVRQKYSAGSEYSTLFGRGANFSGTFTIGASDIGNKLFIAVGQLPSNNSFSTSYSGGLPSGSCFNGGGGGTFFAIGSSLANSSPIVVAGGGASERAGYQAVQADLDAPLDYTGDGNDGKNGGVAGGTNGSGGDANGAYDGGTAGAGFNTRGDQNFNDAATWSGGTLYSWSARAFVDGAQGSKSLSVGASSPQPHGGFGGGGSGGWGGSGGGGGYSGGGGGTNDGGAGLGGGGGGGNFKDSNRATSTGNPVANVSGPGTLYIAKVP